MNKLMALNNSVDAREVHEKLNIKTRYDMWIGRIIAKYDFIDGEDFCTFLGESKGGRKPIEYAVSIGMAKELCMLADNEKGRQVRKAYIKLEKYAYKKDVVRLAGIEARKSLTDCVKDSGENERMHGHGYSSFTKLVYKIAGIEYTKQDNFRDTLSAADLDRVKTIEKMMDALLSLGKQYGEIKDTLASIFTVQEISA